MFSIYLRNILLCIILLFISKAFADSPITILVGFPPGGGNYIVGQIISESANRLGYKSILEIKAGAGGIIGMNECVSRVEDKNLICIASQAQYVYSVTIPTEIRKFEPENLSYVKMIGYSPNVLVTSSRNNKTISEIIEDMRVGKPVSFASGALGLKVLSNWLFTKTNARNSVIVEYKGVGPAINDVIGGHVNYAFAPYTAVQSQISGGLLRVVANAGADAPQLNDYPKLQKYVPGIDEDTTMFGVVMGPRADQSSIDNYNSILTRILQDDSTRKQLETIGIFIMPRITGPADFKKFAQEERTRFETQLKILPPQ